MALGVGSFAEITMVMTWFSQQCLNVWQYRVETYPPTVTPVQLAEAWWNHVKLTYRPMAVAALGDTFLSVRVRELNDPLGDYAEFAVPTAEKPGTRATPGSGDYMPPNSAAAVRLVVGSRVTRPGQKRFPFLEELDNSAGQLVAGFQTLVTNHMNVMTANMLLGAPAATVVLDPLVVRKDATGFVIASQPIVGFLVSPLVATQNTRKIGRGS